MLAGTLWWLYMGEHAQRFLDWLKVWDEEAEHGKGFVINGLVLKESGWKIHI